jgi:hypothetical protein
MKAPCNITFSKRTIAHLLEWGQARTLVLNENDLWLSNLINGEIQKGEEMGRKVSELSKSRGRRTCTNWGVGHGA